MVEGPDIREPKGNESTPRGTLFVLMIYIIVLAGMWGVLYWTMVQR